MVSKNMNPPERTSKSVFECLIVEILNANLISCPNCGNDRSWRDGCVSGCAFCYKCLSNSKTLSNIPNGKLGYATCLPYILSSIIETSILDQNTLNENKHSKNYHTFYLDKNGLWVLSEDVKEPDC